MCRIHPERRQRLRMARRLEQRLSRPAASPPLELPEEVWLRCGRLVRQIQKPVTRRLPLARQQVQQQLRAGLAELRRALEQVTAAAAAQSATAIVATKPTLVDLDQELAGLAAEFDAQINLRERSISVITDPVTLEDVSLGPFEIVLELEGGEALPGYRIVALEPSPAAASDDTTHPHVQSETLCEGEGRVPIRRALEQGRLTDFFQIVTQILHTYNAGSAYVCLDDWDGTACTGCGLSVADDEGSTCARCDGTLCGECSCTCEGCQTSYCVDCLGECAACEEGSCRDCLSACAACRRTCCEACLEEGTCAACREAAAERAHEAESAMAQPA